MSRQGREIGEDGARISAVVFASNKAPFLLPDRVINSHEIAHFCSFTILHQASVRSFHCPPVFSVHRLLDFPSLPRHSFFRLPVMLVKLLLTTLTVLSTATALPAELTTHITESHRILARLGIDPSGPIPSDAVPMPGGGFSFEADSPTSHWVRVQPEIAPPADAATLSERATSGYSGLSLTMWGGHLCDGSGAYVPNAKYGVQYVGDGPKWYNTLQWKGRALLSQEQLDISYVDSSHPSNKCGIFARSAKKGAPPQCFQTGSYSCFNLWHY